MSKRKMVSLDGNEAAAYVAHNINEVIAIYPITPSSNMGEFADEWSAKGVKNLWGTIPVVMEMQSEGGASGAVHGALQTGALTTTFTASQGLLLMIPNMYKIAGELTSTVFHVSARTIATHALSIFGDHSDVMAVRATGFALLSSNSVQEVMDFALISQAASLKSRVPFVHFFDGFRISHEVQKVERLNPEDMRALIDDKLVMEHRSRALSPDRPVLRGTAQNPDVFFQARERINPYYEACPEIVQEAMDKFSSITGRQYKLFEYTGAPDAEKVIIMMGSGAEAAHEAVDYLVAKDEKVGLLKVRLYRPFSVEHFISALPESTRKISVLDRTKEPGAGGEPLYKDIVTALSESFMSGTLPMSSLPVVVGGRYGLSSKEFTPAMVKGVFDELGKEKPKNYFTVGITDDVTQSSIDYDPSFSTEEPEVVRAMFYGLGADGTVGANKNSVKIIGEVTDNYAQGYFVYDSKKSGARTVSHLRFGPNPIHSTYLISKASFVACHQWVFMEKYDMLKSAEKGAVFLVNSPFGPDKVWENLPRKVQEQILEKSIKLFVIDAYAVADETGMGQRINTIMQTCFFAISGVLPREEAIAQIKNYIKKTYGKKGDKIVEQNFYAVDKSLENLHQVDYSGKPFGNIEMPPVVPENAPDFVKKFTAPIIEGNGDDLPVSIFSADGTFPTGTTKWEKRNIALEIPVWNAEICAQCGKCSLVCPHAAIRIKVFEPTLTDKAPATFKTIEAKGKDFKDMFFTVQVAPEDCTGCGACVDTCPVKNKENSELKAINMVPQPPLRKQEKENWDFFLSLPNLDRAEVNRNTVKGSQLLEPLFEFSGACNGCGETAYVKLLTQLFGDRTIIANATGCSSIYGGNLPTTPFTTNKDGRGPSWSNSLFEDNAEFGLGFRLTIDKHTEFALELLKLQASELGDSLVEAILNADQSSETGIAEQRKRVDELKEKLKAITSPQSTQLLSLADYLVKKSVWILGGDGWAYDIGYGGLDHVIASGKNVNILVVDTEVYSNTGGQCSKATPMGAIAKFAAGGKPSPKKDLCMLAMTYGSVYVARVAMLANDRQTVKAFLEAEAYDGPSLIVAYSHCIAHGYALDKAAENQKAAVNSGYWPLTRFNPNLIKEGKNPLTLDSKAPTVSLKDYTYKEARFKMLTKQNPEAAAKLMEMSQKDVALKWKIYEQLANMDYSKE